MSRTDYVRSGVNDEFEIECTSAANTRFERDATALCRRSQALATPCIEFLLPRLLLRKDIPFLSV